MKPLRALTGTAALALVASSTLLVASSASAADLDVAYVTADDFGAEAGSYLDQWFTGDGSTGSIASAESGLTVDGKMQILNGDTPATGLVNMVAGADIQASGNPDDLLELKFQISVFGDPTSETDKVFTTLYPATAGPDGLDADDMWITSNPIPVPGTALTYDDSDRVTLTDFEEALEAINPETGYEILAFGATLGEGYTATISSITWAGKMHLFTPAPAPDPLPTEPPTLEATPDDTPTASLPAAEGHSGATHTIVLSDGTFEPHENVYVTWYSAPVFGGWYQANANGGLNATVTIPTRLAAGAHTLQVTGSTSNVTANGSFVVMLPATGADLAPVVIGGSLFLLIGAGLGAVALRRRATATH